MDRNIQNYAAMLMQPPHASAKMNGSGEYPNIHGTVRFYQTRNGVLVAAEIGGLPHSHGVCQHSVFNCELSQNILLIGDAVALTLQHILMGQTAVQGGDFLIVWHSLPSFPSLRTMPNRLCYQQGYHNRSDKSSVLRNFLHLPFHEVSELILSSFLCLCIEHIMHIVDRAFDFHIMCVLLVFSFLKFISLKIRFLQSASHSFF